MKCMGYLYLRMKIAYSNEVGVNVDHNFEPTNTTVIKGRGKWARCINIL